MDKEAPKLNIYQRINAVQAKIDYIKRDKVVQTYKAVTHDQVTALIRVLLVEFGIVIIPALVSTVTVDTGSLTAKGTPTIRVEAIYEFKFVNKDDPQDFFVSTVSAHALDTGDKAPGKALSYAKKALMLKVFEIETGEDDESRYKEEDQPPSITEDQAATLTALIEEVKADKTLFLKFFKVSKLDDLSVPVYPAAVKMLESKRKHKEAA